VPSVFQNADRYEDTLEHCGAELLMLKNWMLVCSKAKMEIPIQYTVTLEQSFLGICNEPLNCKNTAPGRLLACQRRHLRRRYTVWLPG
jgi:hypothetical protein